MEAATVRSDSASIQREIIPRITAESSTTITRSGTTKASSLTASISPRVSSASSASSTTVSMRVRRSATTFFVSAASVWEIAIKRALGRIVFPLEDLDTILTRAGFEELPIASAHAIAAGGLPRHHADPFDRMLIAQARVEDLTLASEDSAFGAYDVRLFGAAPGR